MRRSFSSSRCPSRFSRRLRPLASSGISVAFYPGLCSTPDRAIEIDYNVCADWCPAEDFFAPIYVDYVEVSGSNGFHQTSSSGSGTFIDYTAKPKDGVSYDVVAHLICSDWWGEPVWSPDFYVSSGASASVRLTIETVELWDWNSLAVPYPIPNTYCSISNETNGFTGIQWFQVFGMLDAWGDPFFDWAEVRELALWTLTLKTADSGHGQTRAMESISSASFVDIHMSLHPNCCNTCVCEVNRAATWDGRGNGWQRWLLDNHWIESCFYFYFYVVLL
jgi:hypothetical protein